MTPSAAATIKDLGETALIERVAERVRAAGADRAPGGRAVIGIGDDAAAWRPNGLLVVTTDAMVEGVHFRPSTSSWADVGWKAWVSNVSDVAAMGAEPVAGVVALGLPPALPLVALDALYDGMLEACAAYETGLLGGDVTSSPTAFVSVAMTGTIADAPGVTASPTAFASVTMTGTIADAPGGAPLARSAGRPGDALCVTGPLGASRGGLLLLERGDASDNAARQALIRAHRRPSARVDAGLALRGLGVRCAMDVSDGLAADVRKLARASGLAARVETERVPVAPALLQEFGVDALRLAVEGGEDYELLFAAPPEIAEAVVAALPGSAVIGALVEGEPGSAWFLDAQGAPVAWGAAGWEHLR